MSKVQKFIELVEDRTGSKTFCVLPWIHVATRPNGDSRLCCGSNASQATKGIMDGGLVKNNNGIPANFGKDSLASSWNNEYMRNVRTTMLSGNIPNSCLKCFEEEDSGIVSKRVWETYYWHQEGIDIKRLVSDTTGDGKVPPEIRYLDLRLGHTCNLKCVMCSPHDSSRWVQDYDNLVSKTQSTIVLSQIGWDKNKFNNTWYERPELWYEIYEQIPNIRQLYFAGGEPLMIKEHKKFLEEIIRRGYADKITVRYNSNGTLVDDSIIDIWSRFKEVFFAFSIDAVVDRNHYIRYPAEWQEIESSLEKLDNTPNNIKVSIACAVQIFNIKHVIDFAKWKIKKNFKKINLHEVFDIESGGGILNMHMVYIPTFLSARILPKEDKVKLRQEFENFRIWLWDNYRQDDDFWNVNPNGWSRWLGVLKFVEAEDHSHLLPDFKEYVNNLDNIRNTDVKKVFPELAHLL